MSFYTSVIRYGNSILYRGYDDNGKRVIRKDFFAPKFFIPTKKETGWHGLDGAKIGPITFKSMRESKAWIDQYKDVQGLRVYGTSNYIHQYITSKYPREIKFDRDKINVTTIDIETEYDGGFPEPERADQKILAITLKNNIDGIYWVWGYGDYDVDAALIKPVKYIRCKSEQALLKSFIEFFCMPTKCPDVITGWNVRFFDMPYLINRTNNILGLEYVKKFSPWGMVEGGKITRRNKEDLVYDIRGIQILDYFELFQKFGYTYGQQESYRLNHIAYVVLGEKKLSYEESGSLKNLYKDDFQKYIDYNMKDVQLVDKLEEKMGLITLAMTIAYKGGVNYTDTFGVTSMWESVIYRKLNSEKRVPPLENFIQCKSKKFAGAYVKHPQTGMHDWVVSFDLNSLYPNIIVQWNMSPETLVDQSHENGVDHYLRTKDKVVSTHAVSANGSTYSKKSIGVIPDLIIDYYSDRRSIKEMMLAAEQQYQKEKTFQLEKEINTLHNQQMAIKILMNSLYGALGNQYFKYFDLRLAEGVTLTGQLAIQWAERALNESMNKIMKTGDKDYVIAIDTDSLYVNFGPMMKKLNPKDPVKFLDKICSEHFEPVFKKCYDELFKKMNCYKPRMEMAREVIADRGIWAAKKRYILNVHNSEGVQFKEPKLKIMGIEAIKSSTPEVCRDKFQEIFKIMMTQTESDVQKFIMKFREEFRSLPPEDVSFPRSVSNITSWKDRKTIYSKGSPIHVRGSLLYNKYIKDMKLSRNYELIENGTRIKFCYLKLPNHIRENVISYPEALPKEFKLDKYVDYDLQFDKTFLEPLKLILDAIGWNPEEQNTLEDFFI